MLNNVYILSMVNTNLNCHCCAGRRTGYLDPAPPGYPGPRSSGCCRRRRKIRRTHRRSAAWRCGGGGVSSSVAASCKCSVAPLSNHLNIMFVQDVLWNSYSILSSNKWTWLLRKSVLYSFGDSLSDFIMFSSFQNLFLSDRAWIIICRL